MTNPFWSISGSTATLRLFTCTIFKHMPSFSSSERTIGELNRADDFNYSEKAAKLMTKKLFVYTMTLALPLSSAASTPVERVGGACPTGYYRTGNYCKPIPSSRSGKAIVKEGKSCPTGFYSAGDYCKRMSGSDKEVISRENDVPCPTGWYRAGKYCAKQ
ncbi:hypothetical protein F0M18_00370 [Pseudohalioglobus sediminis]|uniref:Uncharacterized protein n=1 Tax=Pseudohalioglobus sediminis TaxID=2606449 RepID=A0A5B0X3R7_9GAMM|nr:hypothetical protein [Pseudohalioglobus sediminis]KAA1193936.1 hypothetical protein F0M18_00370 [Pseudohalioglobus sediminis]